MSNINLVRSELARLGWAPHMINGMVGRLQAESGRTLNTRALNRGDGSDGTNSIGIAQWNSDRARNLKSFAQQQGMTWDDPILQARFINHEMRGSEGKAGSAMFSSKSVDEAARAAMMYERPAGFTWNNPTAGHNWSGTLRNARALAGVPMADAPVPGSPAARVSSAHAPFGMSLATPPASASPGVSIVDSASAATASAPDPAIAPMAEPSLMQRAVDLTKSDGFKEGLSGLRSAFGAGNGSSSGNSGELVITPSSIGNDQQSSAIAASAQSLMDSIIQNRRRGLTLNGRGMI